MFRYLVLDIETTGLDTTADAVVEIAAVRVENGIITGEFEELIAPRMKSSPAALNTHKLSDDFLKENGKPPAEVFAAFIAFIGEDALIAHNGINYDFPLILNELKRYHIPFGTNRLLDTVLLSKSFLKKPGAGHRLEDLCRTYNIPNLEAHRAMSDVKATAEVMKLILDKETSFEELWKICFQFDLQSLANLPPGFELLDKALRTSSELKVFYAGKDKAPGERWILPSSLYIDKAGNRCLKAMCLRDNKMKFFRLDRILKLIE